ncbi:MAG: hypothetical protein JXQ75_06005 [Phycisphaerae bacterium]|nr:hypothetical protein [Phycisphaerae bacterium]
MSPTKQAEMVFLLMVLVHAVCACDLFAQQTSPAGDASRPIVGAIRWDAWFGNNGTVGTAVHRSLGPSKWHNRLPFYAKVHGEEAVEIDGTPQSVMDREIEYAAGAGLDYWAFVTYAADDPLSLALKRYLSSSVRSRVNFCLITECGRWSHQAFVDRVVSLMQEPGYQRVLDARPLLYLGFIEEKWLTKLGGVEGFRRVLDTFRATLAAKGLPKPYLVVMDFSPRQGKKWADALGGDAISSYVAGVGQGAIPYRQMVDNLEHFWEGCRKTGAHVVPIVVTGWDPRPRTERPMPWGNPYGSHEGEVNRSEQATPAAIADHLRAALRWLAAHRDAAPAQAAIIYAWNEFDEGGWLAPTLSEGAARLDAIARVLRLRAASIPSASSRPAAATQP